MRIYLLKAESMQNLKENIENNLHIYRGDGIFPELKANDNSFFDVEKDFSELDLENGSKADAKNAKIIYDVLKDISSEIARREDFWVSLTHGRAFNYSRSRWKIHETNDASAIASIKSHFFAEDNRSIESRNAISRLFWGAKLAERVKEHAMEDVLSVLFDLSDFRMNFIERPSLIQSPVLFSAIMSQMITAKNEDSILLEREPTRDFLTEINQIMGSTVIEALPQHKVDKKVAYIAEEIIEKYNYSKPMVA